MLRSLTSLEHYKVSATDGEIGHISDFLFDDNRWVVRYLVVKTGGFFSERRVLISPVFFRKVDWSAQMFHLALTIEKIKNSPDIDTNMPVSRRQEREIYGYYGYPCYWADSGVWGIGLYAGLLSTGNYSDPSAAHPSHGNGDLHMRSANEVRGYHIDGIDGDVGHLADYIVDDETWELRYLVIDTSNWWMGKKVLIAPRWASETSWEKRIVRVNLTRESIKNSPEWNPNHPIDREFETLLHDHYNRPVYWSSASQSKK
jgi:hypothetical protein